MKSTIIILAIFILISSPFVVNAQVLGTCGSSDENEPHVAIESAKSAKTYQVQHVLRPGDRAVNFDLTAVVGDEIQNIKLSDYNGKWRVVCFYPADFTFV